MITLDIIGRAVFEGIRTVGLEPAVDRVASVHAESGYIVVPGADLIAVVGIRRVPAGRQSRSELPVHREPEQSVFVRPVVVADGVDR